MEMSWSCARQLFAEAGMKKLLCSQLIFIAALGIASAQTSRSTAKTSNVTGYYQFKSGATRNSLEVLELPEKKIKFHILALWFAPHNRDNVHNSSQRCR